ncbi:sulfite exporter TauE/SafE family protein [Chitinophagales bacterium]|nr:sulfite exporter TauE/SafE family protein [Chitinophagales bacterium]
MDILSYLLAVLIGISLGLIGGGGSILTVPILVYVAGVNPILATAYSLFVVGASSLVGTVNNFRKGLVSVKTAIIFAVPSFVAVYLTRLYIIPALPDQLFSFGSLAITKELGIMLFFAFVMVVAALSMLRKKSAPEEEATIEAITYNYPLIGIEGFIVGILTGLVGAGGGFLIIPALVLLAKLPMKLAVGTSLTIIAAKSLIGFIGDIQAGQLIDWPFLLLFTACSVVGIVIGGILSNYIPGHKLKKGFAWFVLAMAAIILIKELLLN